MQAQKVELKALRNGFDSKLMKEMWKYTWPLLIFGIIGIMNQVADKICYRFIVPGQEGETQLGIYGACVKIAMIMAMITQAFRYAYEPFVFGENREEAKKSKEMQAKVMKYFVIFTLLAFVAVMSYIDVLKFIISSDYWEGLAAVPIVMMAEIFMGVYFNLSFWYKLTDRTWWGAVMSAVGAGCMICVNVLLVPVIGYWACAWGGFAGYGVAMLMSWLIGRKYYPVPYDMKSILGFTALALGIFAAMTALGHPRLGLSPWLTMGVGTVLLAVYGCFTLKAVGVFRK